MIWSRLKNYTDNIAHITEAQKVILVEIGKHSTLILEDFYTTLIMKDII